MYHLIWNTFHDSPQGHWRLEQLIDLQLAEGILNVTQPHLLAGLPKANLAQKALVLSVPGEASGKPV